MTGALRRVLFWLHLICGVTAGVIVLVMSVTGVMLTYQRQMQWWADTRHFYAEPAPGAERQSIEALVEAACRADPERAPTAVTVRSDPAAPAAVTLGTKTVYVNPYTAEVYGEGTGARLRTFFSGVIVWHRYLALSGDSRPAGKAITGAANLMFLFIVLSGMYLWWPRTLTWTQFRGVMWFRGGLRPKARDFNWHNTLGFWSALPLAIVVYSGVVISYPWATSMLYRLMGDTPPRPAAGRASGGAADVPTAAGVVGPSLDRALMAAMAYERRWTVLGVRVPPSVSAPLTVTIDRGDGGQPHLRGTLTLDATTMAVTTWEGLEEQTPGRRARSILRFAHTGEAGGLAGQTIAGVASAAASVLVYTGLALSWRRWRGVRS